MLTYEKAIRSPKTFKAITGMTRPQFDLLYADVERKYGDAETARLSKRPRERNIGAGHRFALSLRDRLLMLPFHHGCVQPAYIQNRGAIQTTLQDPPQTA